MFKKIFARLTKTFERPSYMTGDPEKLRIRQERQKAMMEGRLKEWEAQHPEEAVRMGGTPEGEKKDLASRREELAKLYPDSAAEKIKNPDNQEKAA